MKNRKKAISLAEIIIVVVIVAIVALIFITMPKKNVGKMDKAKYYVAYDLLKQLQNEQLANDANNDKKVSLTAFGIQAGKWLNTIDDPDANEANKITISKLSSSNCKAPTSPCRKVIFLIPAFFAFSCADAIIFSE